MHSRNLVVMPVGRDSLNSEWLVSSDHSDFDVILLAYHPVQSINLVFSPTVKVHEYLNYKWWMIQDFFNQHPAYLERYESFFFLDDDVEVKNMGINQLFDYFNKSSFVLAQPSLTYDSHASWNVLFHKKFSAFRYITTVELMCPLMKRETLRFLLPSFKLTKSGWGVDLLWGKMIAEKFGQKKIAVVDLIQVRHGKPVGKGELYSKLEQPAHDEEESIRQQYGLGKMRIEELNCIENSFLQRLICFKIRKLLWKR